MGHIKLKNTPMTNFTNTIFDKKNQDLNNLQRAQVIFELANTFLSPILWEKEKVIFFQNLALIELANNEIISVADLYKRYTGIVFEPTDTDCLSQAKLDDYDSKRIAVISRNVSQHLPLESFLITDHNKPQERERTLQIIFSRLIGSLTGYYLSLLLINSDDAEMVAARRTINQTINNERAMMYVCDPTKTIMDLVYVLTDNLPEIMQTFYFEAFGRDPKVLFQPIEEHFVVESVKIYKHHTMKLFEDAKELYSEFIRNTSNNKMQLLSLFHAETDSTQPAQISSGDSILIGIHPYEVSNTTLNEYNERMYAILEKYIEMDS